MLVFLQVRSRRLLLLLLNVMLLLLLLLVRVLVPLAALAVTLVMTSCFKFGCVFFALLLQAGRADKGTARAGSAA
jgi:hypothetical protein